MPRILPALVVASLLPSGAFAAGLPLDDGDYGRVCAGGPADFMQSFDVQTVSEGRQKGQRYLYPMAEGQSGGCTTGTIRVSGRTYSGSAPCTEGNRIQSSSGTYRFSLEVLNRRSFVSKGVKYSWCAPHR